jgi:hypothetical protein
MALLKRLCGIYNTRDALLNKLNSKEITLDEYNTEIKKIHDELLEIESTLKTKEVR